MHCALPKHRTSPTYVIEQTGLVAVTLEQHSKDTGIHTHTHTYRHALSRTRSAFACTGIRPEHRCRRSRRTHNIMQFPCPSAVQGRRKVQATACACGWPSVARSTRSPQFAMAQSHKTLVLLNIPIISFMARCDAVTNAKSIIFVMQYLGIYIDCSFVEHVSDS